MKEESKMKYKVGDKVRIRKDLKVGERYDGVIAREELIEKYKNK